MAGPGHPRCHLLCPGKGTRRPAPAPPLSGPIVPPPPPKKTHPPFPGTQSFCRSTNSSFARTDKSPAYPTASRSRVGRSRSLGLEYERCPRGAARGQAWRLRGPPEGPGSCGAPSPIAHSPGAVRAAPSMDSRLSGACSATLRRPRRALLPRSGRSATAFAGFVRWFDRSLARGRALSKRLGRGSEAPQGGATSPPRPPLGSQPTPAR